MLRWIIKILIEYWSLFLDGITMTLTLSLLGTILGFIIALFFSVLRIQKPHHNDQSVVKVLKIVGYTFVRIYVLVFRGTPMIVQAAIFYFGFYSIGIRWSPFQAGLFTVSLNTAAYLTEVLRGGIASVDKGQNEAARSIGLSGAKSFLYIVFPQAIKNSFASIGNEFIINIKDTAVLSTIMVVDLFAVADTAAGKYYKYLEAMLLAAVMYLVLTSLTSFILIQIEKHMNVQTKEIVSSN